MMVGTALGPDVSPVSRQFYLTDVGGETGRKVAAQSLSNSLIEVLARVRSSTVLTMTAQ